MTETNPCYVCRARPQVSASGDLWVIECHGYTMGLADKERTVRVWNAEQEMLSGYLKRSHADAA